MCCSVYCPKRVLFVPYSIEILTAARALVQCSRYSHSVIRDPEPFFSGSDQRHNVGLLLSGSGNKSCLSLKRIPSELGIDMPLRAIEKCWINPTTLGFFNTTSMMNSNRLGKYTHIRSVCEWCAVGVNLVQKQVTAGTPVR